MKLPTCQVLCLGEVSQGGKQFLYGLQASNLIELVFEPSFEKFIASPPSMNHVVAFENRPDSRTAITQIRQKGIRTFILWFGRTFSKEDFEFAMGQRIFWLFDNSQTNEKDRVEALRRLVTYVDHDVQFEQVLRAIKGILLQDETDAKDKPLLNELKVAIAKIEKCGTYNEFVSIPSDVLQSTGSQIPFHRSQTFGDALWTVNDLERTGVLWVRGELPAEEGKVEFLQGRIVAAQTGKIRSLKAIYRMFLWDNPKFLFMRKDAHESSVGEQLNTSMKYLTAEGEKLKARHDKIRRELPPPALRLELEPSALHAGTTLTRNEFSTLASVIEFNRVSHVIDYNSLPDVDLYECLINLRRTKVIRVAA